MDAPTNLWFLFLILRSDESDWELNFEVRPLTKHYDTLERCNDIGDYVSAALKADGRFPQMRGYVCYSVDEFASAFELPHPRVAVTRSFATR